MLYIIKLINKKNNAVGASQRSTQNSNVDFVEKICFIKKADA